MRSNVLPETTHESRCGGRTMIRNDGTSYVPGQLPGSRVWAAKLPTASYSEQKDVALPELSAVTPTSVMTAVRSLFETAGLDRELFGSEDSNPLGSRFERGSRGNQAELGPSRQQIRSRAGLFGHKMPFSKTCLSTFCEIRSTQIETELSGIT